MVHPGWSSEQPDRSLRAAMASSPRFTSGVFPSGSPAAINNRKRFVVFCSGEGQELDSVVFGALIRLEIYAVYPELPRDSLPEAVWLLGWRSPECQPLTKLP